MTLGDGLPDEGDATDGPAGARDTLIGVENVTGGSGPDTLIGSGTGNVLIGGPGGDDITGLGSGDVLRGEAGADVIHANDGIKDTVDCGADADRAELDLLDAPVINGVRQIPATCETAIVTPVDELPGLEILSRSLRPRDGFADVRLHCPRKVKTGGCAGRLTLAAPNRPRKALAAATYRLRRGGRATVELRLRRTAARTLVATASGRGPSGRPHVSVRRLTVR